MGVLSTGGAGSTLRPGKIVQGVIQGPEELEETLQVDFCHNIVDLVAEGRQGHLLAVFVKYVPYRDEHADSDGINIFNVFKVEYRVRVIMLFKCFLNLL